VLFGLLAVNLRRLGRKMKYLIWIALAVVPASAIFFGGGGGGDKFFDGSTRFLLAHNPNLHFYLT
jgi:hypothetical protein